MFWRENLFYILFEKLWFFWKKHDFGKLSFWKFNLQKLMQVSWDKIKRFWSSNISKFWPQIWSIQISLQRSRLVLSFKGINNFIWVLHVREGAIDVSQKIIISLLPLINFRRFYFLRNNFQTSCITKFFFLT